MVGQQADGVMLKLGGGFAQILSTAIFSGFVGYKLNFCFLSTELSTMCYCVVLCCFVGFAIIMAMFMVLIF